ncbi:MAG: DMT family transporter [Alphaproteobacteria bacterium]|nr:DMT family transporter [Alphaproteobacteria bacterium]
MSVRRPIQDRPLLGIGLMLVFTVLAIHLDAMAKWFTRHYPIPELMWIRYASQTAAFCVAGAILGWRRIALTRAPRLQVARGAALLLSAGLFVAGLSVLPFATTKVLGDTAPLIVAAISLPLLGERVGWRRWIAILGGFAGIVVVVRPDIGAIEPAMLLPIGTACSYALYQVMTRSVAGIDAPLPCLFYTSLVGFAVTSVAVPFFWVPPTPIHLVVLFFHGLGTGLGHFILIRAFAFAPASLLAPFGYASLIWAVALGYFVFGEAPDWGTLVGGGLIALAGIHLVRVASRGT